MQKWIVRGAIALTLGMSLYFAVHQTRGWFERGWTSHTEFDDFVEEARRIIPPDARVRVTAQDTKGKRLSAQETSKSKLPQLLSAHLHPRILVSHGHADWIIEIPDKEFKRELASIRKVVP